MSSRFRFVIQGAGSVGSAIGGSLAAGGHDVTLVARKPHCDAIRRQGGLVLKTLSGERLQPVCAVEKISEVEFSDNSVIFQTMKAHNTVESLGYLKVLSRSMPVVCWQNGIENEEAVSRMFKNVYGGVVRFTATMASPGETRFAGTGKLIMGRYPEGMDDTASQVCDALGRTSFSAILSTNIMQDKWLKLLVNLISCVKPMTKKAAGEPGKRVAICRNLLLEGIAVLTAAGISALSTNGTEDSPEQMVQNFDQTLRLAEGVGQGMDLKNSTWQSLYRRQKTLENDYYTGVIIRMSEETGVPAPYNCSVLYWLHEMARREMGPESLDADAIVSKAAGFSSG